MQCPRCAAQNPEGARYCEDCGAPLEVSCPSCGAEVTPGKKFCRSCGGLLAPQPTHQFASPRTYTPRHLVEKILSARAALEGERKQVTVLFCDIVASTALADRLGDEGMHDLLNRFFELALAEVHRYEGTINQFLGDGFMALFGAPIAHEDHARRAVHAALAIQHVLESFQAELQRAAGIDFRVRMGLNTGHVVVAGIGDNLRMDYTAVGDTTNLAARMLDLAGPDQIVAAEDTGKAVSGFFELAPLGERAIKGKPEPVTAYAVLRARGLRTRLEVEAERGLSPFVGREQELAVLQERWAEAKAGRGQVAFLMGEPGMGKSRLLLEFRRRLTGEPLTWLTGRCISFGKEIAHLPIIELLKQSVGVEEADDGATISATIERGMTALGEELRPAIPYVKYLLSVDPGDETVLSMDVQQRRVKLFETIRAMTLKGAEGRPLVLVVEDLHWIDKSSEELLSYLADSIAAARVLLILTYRRDYQNPFGERTYFTRLALRSLSEGESARLAEGMLATAELPAELRELVFRKAEGNPFFVEEVLKSLLELGGLERQNGGYRLARPAAELHVPDTIEDVIMARIDRLEESPKRALQLASVIGREFTVRLLHRISDLQVQLERLLQELKVLEFIYERRLYPELAYMFKHALTHDVAYNSLLVQRRKALHRVVAMAIEELYGDRLPEYYEMLAYHYERAEEWEKALDYLVKAGQKAQQAYANREALALYDRALEVCARLGAAVEPEKLLTLYAGKGAVHFFRSEFLPSIDAYQHVLKLARQVGDKAREAEVLYQIGVDFLWAHEFERALDYADRARTLALAIDSKSSLAGSLWLTGKVHFMTSKLSEGARCFEEGLRISREGGDKFLEGYILFELGLLDNWRGEYQRSRQLQEQAIEIGQAHNLAYILCWTVWARGLACCARGEYELALRSMQEALKLSDQLGDKVARPRILNTLGWAYGELYNLETAVRYNQEAAEIANTIGEPELIGYSELNLAADYLLLGDLEEAQRYLDHVYRTAQQRRKWGDEWMKWRYSQYLYHTLGELRLRKDDPDQALMFAEECLKLAESTSTKKNLVKGWRLRGQALGAKDRIPEAIDALQRALGIAHEIGNPPQLWKTCHAIGQLHERQGEAEQARAAYASALQVIEEVASRLQDQEIKRIFLAARPVQELRASLQRSRR